MVTVRRHDLDRRADIHWLVVAFYREVVFDDVLGPVFEEVAETELGRTHPAAHRRLVPRPAARACLPGQPDDVAAPLDTNLISFYDTPATLDQGSRTTGAPMHIIVRTDASAPALDDR